MISYSIWAFHYVAYLTVEIMLILGFFVLEGNPLLYVRELYYNGVLF